MEKVALPPLSKEALSIVLGGIYAHYKRLPYQVLVVARDTESLEEMVVYQGLYGDRDIWVRPVSMFLENILIEGISLPRFKLIQEPA
jgi:hypothetical protein